MPSSLTIRRLRLADSSLIFHSRLDLPKFRTISQLRQSLQRLQQICLRQVWLVFSQQSPDTDPLALFALQELDQEQYRCRLLAFFPKDQNDPALLGQISSFCFAQPNIFRLELELAEIDQKKIACFQAAGWSEEARLKAAAYQEKTALFEDRLLFRLLRPEARDTAVAFYLFKKGLLALVASPERLIKSQFLRFGQRADDDLLQGQAQLLGLLNERGQLLARAALRKKLDQASAFYSSRLPLLIEATRQLDDYFAGSRTSFTLQLLTEQGSDFQKRVWQALTDIPYGQTRTYEDIALAIGAADQESARQLARAVGSACSANPFPLLWPCHRVIGKNGRLTGFRGGLDIKEYLLGHEIMGLR